jgi:hypothetical protein
MKTTLLLIVLQCLMTTALMAQKPYTIWTGTPYATIVGNVAATDTLAYYLKIKALANGDASGRWPAKIVYPSGEPILPYKRVVAFYGNLFSKNMGILGQLPKADMLKKLAGECVLWEKADTLTPVLPALHYIVATAQASPGKDGMYRNRMPATEIEKVIGWSREINGLTFLDIQTGHSTVKAEVVVLEKYLAMPDVHLGIDPEYSMKNGGVPCTSIGTFDAQDINDAIDFLVKIVQENQLTPKILVVHRFTKGMVTNYKKIKLVPEVQVVMDMDGFGGKSLKLDSYKAVIYREPVQFAGFKLFYKIDKPVMYRPGELMKMKPIPVYIQYQ